MTPQLLFLIPLLPLACALVNILFGMRMPRSVVAGLAVAGVAASSLLTLLAWPLAAGAGTRVTLYTWLGSGALEVPVALLFDPLAAPMTLMVTAVSTLIHLFAVGYMAREEGGARFFALLNLFVFAMLLIVLADNLLLTFLGWEGVGFCSYALIGFWYREGANAEAGRKAFLVTRVGDVFFGIALLWLFALFGTLSISEINLRGGELAPAVVTALTLLLLLGASGKSAQLPLMTWLPDAMAGPTPVSALIHAATMVTAGVYLLCRLFPLIALSPTGLAVIAVVGAATAAYAASCALAQREIKRVLAYSTMSQVGYMFLAVGAGSVAAAQFHLLTHAFFKALLFMAAGCVIHLAGDENDITRMGGLARHRLVFGLFLAGALCLAGAPLTGGFFSKDGILLALFAQPGPLAKLLWGAGVVTALVTAVYTFRLVYLVFAGTPRAAQHPHPLPALMLWPLVPLALLGLGGGLLNLPALAGGTERLTRYYGALAGTVPAIPHAEELGLWLLATVLCASGWGVAWAVTRGYRPRPEGRLGRFARLGWQADTLVEHLVLRPFRAMGSFCWRGLDLAFHDSLLDGFILTARGAGELMRRLTTGRLTTYLHALAWGFLLFLGWGVLSLLGQ